MLVRNLQHHLRPPSTAGKAPSLLKTKQSHAQALINGDLPQDISISASLILQYATLKNHTSIHHLSNQTLPFCGTPFFPNTLIRAYNIANSNHGFQIYNRMVRENVGFDDHTFPFVLNACSKFSEFRKGLEVHGALVKRGFDDDLFVGNTLLLFYGACSELGCVERVFDEMLERDVVSWNTVIGVFAVNGWSRKAIELFKEMRLCVGLMPNLVSCVSVLPVCASLGDEKLAGEMHCYVVKIGFYDHVNAGNALIDLYGKCRNLSASKCVFEEMGERNEVSWNTMISSYSYAKRNNDAFDIFKAMIDAGMKINLIAITSMLPVLVDLECFNTGKEIHGFSIRRGEVFDLFIANSLIDLYSKSGNSSKASNVFHTMGVTNVVSWNAMIANFAQNGFELEAIRLIREMFDHGEFPNSVSFTNVLPACARVGSLCSGKEIHARSIRTGSTSDLFVTNALTDMYAKCGCLNLARNVFDMSLRDEISYNILIVGYSQTSDCGESLTLFSQMRILGMEHDTVSVVGALSACANISVIKQGKEIHGMCIRRLLHKHLFVANSLSDLYTKCGKINVAREIFNRILNKDAASWNTMILGYGMLGELNTAINFFKDMKKDGVEYDSVSYVAILSACSHGGLLQEGKKYFSDMQTRGIKPTSMHYACMVDLLGRADLLHEAAELIKSLPFDPDANVWGALLGACRIYGNIELGAWAAGHLFRLKPDHCGYYVLLSNMYAEAGKWEEANEVRKLMKSRGVDKNLACSWVHVHDQVHAFGAGEKIETLHSSSMTAKYG